MSWAEVSASSPFSAHSTPREAIIMLSLAVASTMTLHDFKGLNFGLCVQFDRASRSQRPQTAIVEIVAMKARGRNLPSSLSQV